MGEFSFENQALGAFMTYRLDGEETLDSLAMGMLSNNQIPGILPVSCVRTDGGQVVRFRISSLTALMGCWGGAITRQKLLTFLTSFCRAALECRDYLLDPERIVLGWDRVFLDPLTGEARVAYLPVLGAQVQQPTAGAFLRDLLQHTTFAPNEDSSHIPILLNAVNQTNFSLEELYGQLRQLSAGKTPVQPVTPGKAPQPVQPVRPVQPVQPVQAVQPAHPVHPVQPVQPVQPVRPVRPAQPVQSVQPVRPVQPVQPVQPAPGFAAPRPVRPVQGGTVILGGGAAADPGATVCLDRSETPAPQAAAIRLKRRRTGETASVNRPIFRVGREKRVADFCLGAETGYVGSEHAYFLCREDGVYLVDNNSMNHTWLNGQMLPANQPQPVKPGDVIKMADEELDVLPG